MAASRSQNLYGHLYLFFAQELGAVERSTIDFSDRHPKGVWTTILDTGCGMYLHRPLLHPHPVYHKYPENAVRFAHTGGDGVFYSLLLADGRWSDASPVVVTFPADFSPTPSDIAGGNLTDFLRLGIRTGYFALAGLVARAAIGDPQSIEQLESQEFAEWVEPEMAARLDQLAGEFRLKPWRRVAARVAEWQRRYLPLVRHPV
jgi:hypothetical protein